jgi:NhaP-type Na+/H+ or K+/H+ antiporter
VEGVDVAQGQHEAMTVDAALIVVGGATIALGLLSTTLKRVWLSVPLAALALGVLLGPEVLGVVHLGGREQEHRVLEELARITLSVSLVATGLQVTGGDLRANASRAGGAADRGDGRDVAPDERGRLAAARPARLGRAARRRDPHADDPVVAGTLVTGGLAEANLPRWLRRTLQLESGANDRLALAFVLVPLLVLVGPDDGAGAIAGEVLAQVGIGLGGGLTTGLAAAKLLDAAEEHEGVGEAGFATIALALALLTLGFAHALGGTGVLASFVAGVTFSLAVGER